MKQTLPRQPTSEQPGRHVAPALDRAPDGVGGAWSAEGAGGGNHGKHLVQFYRGNEFLYETVSRFVAAGLGGGEGCVIIATAEHLENLRERLAENSFDVPRATRLGQLTLLDADATLAQFCTDGRLDADAFTSLMAPVLERAGRGRNGVVRAYGEMVDVLCAQGRHEAALELERLWEALLANRPVALLCGYSLAGFAEASHAERFRKVCDAHTHVYPADGFSDLRTDDERLREVSFLQQRARSLETELEHRRALELSLREREAELSDFLNNAAEGIHWVGSDGRILWANRAELELLGYSAEEYIGQQIAGFHADADVIQTILRRLTSGEALKGVEARLRAKDGSIRHVLISSDVYRRDGRIIHSRCFTRDITDRKSAEQQLLATAQRLEAVLAQMPSAVAIVEAPSGKLLLANEQNATIFRQPQVALDGVSAYGKFHGLHPDGRDIAPEEWPLSRSIAGGEIVRGEEIHVVRGDGSHGYIRVSSSPIRDDVGRVVAGVVTYDDVTEQWEQRRVTETLLRVSSMLSSELDLDALIQKITDEATAVCRAEFGSFFYNVIDDARGSYMLYTLSGVPREAFAGFPMPRNTEIFAPTFTGSSVVRIDDVKKDPRYGKSAPYNGMPAGHLPVTSYLAVPVKTRNGEVLGGLFFGHSQPAVFTAADERLIIAISAQAAVAIENARAYRALRVAENKAQLERSRLHGLFMQAPAAILMLRGPDHIIAFANPAASKLLPGTDPIGKPVTSAWPVHDSAQLELLDEVYRTGRPQLRSEMPTVSDWNGNGEPSARFFDTAYEPIRDENGDVVGVITFSFEVTEQVAARRRVEAVVSELETANRMKDEFLATVSHELRTPLNAMLGWTRMLRSGSLPEAHREKALETIERNANAQTQLIEDLLDVSRIISGKLRLEIDTVDVPQVVANAIDAVRPAANGKGVEIMQAIDPLATPMLGDAGRLQQVVWNLLSNAVKFTPKGGRVRVFVRKRDSLIEIIVADNGEGIPPDFLPHVFERFRQADATIARKHMGLGLGLAIVRHLVELHGGHVRVESEGRGRGATFIVCLPISPLRWPSAEQTPGARAAAATPALACPELAGVHVLVVEDDTDARELLAGVLEPCHARVSLASNVSEAVQLLDTRPDVIISDIGLPDEDGYAFIRKVRALPADRGGKTPAIALTAYTRVEDRTKALLAGFNMHVPKPVEPAELLACLASLSALFVR